MAKLTWRNMGGGDGLPGRRGRAVVFFDGDTIPLLPRYPKGHFTVFSWDGDSFRVRDFLGGVRAKQDGANTAPSVYEAGRFQQKCSGPLARSVKEADFWRDKLRDITEQKYREQGWKLGPNG